MCSSDLLNPRAARAHSSLGILASEDGRTADAVAQWQEALHAEPREAEKLIAFAAFLRRSGRAADAEPYLQLFVASARAPQYAREIQQARKWLHSR